MALVGVQCLHLNKRPISKALREVSYSARGVVGQQADPVSFGKQTLLLPLVVPDRSALLPGAHLHMFWRTMRGWVRGGTLCAWRFPVRGLLLLSGFSDAQVIHCGNSPDTSKVSKTQDWSFLLREALVSLKPFSTSSFCASHT